MQMLKQNRKKIVVKVFTTTFGEKMELRYYKIANMENYQHEKIMELHSPKND